MATLTLKIPTATSAGDFLQAYICSFNGDSTGTPPTGQGTWTYIRTIQINDGVTADVYNLPSAAASDHGKNVTWTITGTLGAVAGVMLDIANTTGEDDYKAFGLGQQQVITTPGTLGSTPTNVSQVGELVLLAILAAGNITISPPAPWTTIQSISGSQVSILFASLNATSTGAAPSFTQQLASPINSFAAEISYLGSSSILRAFSVA